VFVVMLRGVNVSGHNRLPMADFAAALSELGFGGVTTYVQSGNAVFSGRGQPPTVAAKVSRQLAERFELDVPIVVRTADELRSVLVANPYLAVERDPTKLHVTFLVGAPGAAAGSIEPPANPGRDSFDVVGREVYLHCPDGYGRTKLTNDFFERRLRTTATTRNWRTVLALAELCEEQAGGR
jgi:uncharacterized protein (DUF1697 family)